MAMRKRHTAALVHPLKWDRVGLHILVEIHVWLLQPAHLDTVYHHNRLEVFLHIRNLV